MPLFFFNTNNVPFHIHKIVWYRLVKSGSWLYSMMACVAITWFLHWSLWDTSVLHNETIPLCFHWHIKWVYNMYSHHINFSSNFIQYLSIHVTSQDIYFWAFWFAHSMKTAVSGETCLILHIWFFCKPEEYIKLNFKQIKY